MNKEKLSNMPKQVNSFDVFDTLIGRLHSDPQSIFELVERNYPFPNFKQLRIAAEKSSNGTLEDIYHQFMSMANVSEEKAQDIKEFELSTELSQIFPILENIKKIKNGDILVSDSYYDEDFLKRILNHIDFKKKVQIYITPNGKHTGDIWRKLAQKYQIKEHLGDNPHSDRNMANASGILSRHFARSGYSMLETTAIQYNHRPLANLMRVLRLSNPFHPRTSSYKIWAEQAQLNVPILILYCLALNDYCKKHAIKRLLFTSRDCCHLIKVFNELFPQYESIYFHASRAIYSYPSREYVAYVKSVYSSDSLIVDMHGSGSTCLYFFQKHFNVSPQYVVLVSTLEYRRSLDKISFGEFNEINWIQYDLQGNPMAYFNDGSLVNSPRQHPCRFYPFGERICYGFSDKVEQINYDLIGHLVGYFEDGPVRRYPEYDLRYIYPAHDCIKKSIMLLKHYQFDQFNQELIEFFLWQLEEKIYISTKIKPVFEHPMLTWSCEG